MKRKRILYAVLVALLVIIAGAAVYLNSLLPIITGYAAKNMCSDVFLSSRNPQDVDSIDLNFSFIKYAKNKVNMEEKSVTSSFLWGSSKAIYRDGFGVTLIRGLKEKELRLQKYAHDIDPGYSRDTIAWPLGDKIPSEAPAGVDIAELNRISDRLMKERAYNGNAFAFMVLYNGIPVVEAYKPQFNSHTRFLSWSMAKSFTSALAGILVKDSVLNISKPAGFKEWEKDDRCKITLNDLLQMQSGLKWNENYGSRSDVNLMLYSAGNMAQYAINKSLEFPAGTHWYYSSGTANIVSWLIRKQFPHDSLYYQFAHKRLFNKIGAPDIIFEVDPSGTMVGSSYLYATARDFARFGQLYLNDGVFNGERILPEGWVKYSTTPVTGIKIYAPDDDGNEDYGALFWLNSTKKYPSAPVDMYSSEGHDGQMIFIIPSKEMVVVVLGFSHKPDHEMDLNRLLGDILKTINN
jgi:CubicO group peptidase (beta-lactamase class C family)